MSRYMDNVFALGRMPASIEEPPKGALTPEEIMIERAKAAFAEKERLAKLAGPKVLEELEVADELTPTPVVTGRRTYHPPKGENLRIYEERFGPYPERDFYMKMSDADHERVLRNNRVIGTYLNDQAVKNDLILHTNRRDQRIARDLKPENKVARKMEYVKANNRAKAAKGKTIGQLSYEKMSDERYEARLAENKILKTAQSNARLTELMPNWKEVHATQYPFLSEKAFRKQALENIARGNELNPEHYLKIQWKKLNPIIKDVYKNRDPLNPMGAWLKSLKGFGGKNIIKSIGPIAKVAAPALATYALMRGEPVEAAEIAVGSFLPPGVDFGEELGPPQGSLDYYIEHPWNRPKGVLDFNNNQR